MNPIQQKIASFFSSFPQQTVKRGTQILLPDAQLLPPITLLEQGRVTQYDIAPSGTKVTLNVFKPGAFFPAPAAINHQPNRYYVEVTSQTALLRQSSAAKVEAFLKENPDVTYDLLSRVYRGTEGLLGRMSLLLYGTASARLSYELSIQAERFGDITPDGTAHIHITESELAEQTGLARETVSRELQKLKDQGAITQSRGMITLKKMIH